jgi:hypothetical protein
MTWHEYTSTPNYYHIIVLGLYITVSRRKRQCPVGDQFYEDNESFKGGGMITGAITTPSKAIS